ncbi:MAG: SET domain-containing protein-lysine N-methyltransferase [Chlamydiae bacterium]|nr:SET domain-containing protein-lysine N-methyltransferase [Chlamydiota bacterium]
MPENQIFFNLEKDQIRSSLSKEEFEELLEVKFISKLEFQTEVIEKKVKKLCKKAYQNEEFSNEALWLGEFYASEIVSSFIPNVLIKWINPIVEYGLFANEDFAKNSFMGVYSGEIRKYNNRLDDKNAYCFEYSIAGSKTPFTIDAREKGSLIRFVNHSSTPNLSPIAVYSQEIVHIIFRTNKNVTKGEELTYDYGPNYWARRETPLSK